MVRNGQKKRSAAAGSSGGRGRKFAVLIAFVAASSMSLSSTAVTQGASDRTVSTIGDPNPSLAITTETTTPAASNNKLRHEDPGKKARAAAAAVKRKQDRVRRPPVLTGSGKIQAAGSHAQPKVGPARGYRPPRASVDDGFQHARKPSKQARSTQAFQISMADATNPGSPASIKTESARRVAASVTATGTITGTVIDSTTNTPIADVCVEAWSYDEAPDFTTCSDVNGIFTLASVPAGTYDLGFYDNVHSHIPTFVNHVSVNDGQTINGIVAAMDLGGSVAGTVRGPDGAPIKGACVYAEDAHGNDVGREGCTDANGHYQTTGMPPGQWLVRFEDRAGAHLPEWYNDAQRIADATPVPVTVGAVRSGTDAELARGATVSGTVTSAATGGPLAGVCVYIEPTDDAPASYSEGFACTDENGAYTSNGLYSGSYTVQFFDRNGLYVGQYYDGASGWDSATPVGVTEGGDTSGIDAALVKGGTIAGTVTNAAGQPIKNVCAEAWTRTDGYDEWVDDAQTGADGTYQITGLEGGTYRIKFEDCSTSGIWLDQWYDGGSDFDSATPVSAAVETATPGIDAVLARGGSISGAVTNADTGAPVDACITALAPGADPESGDDSFYSETAADGTYTVGGMAANGPYLVLARDCDSGALVARWYGGARSQQDATAVLVTVGQDSPGADIALPVGGTISGTVTDAGNGVAGICVTAAPSADLENDGSYATTDSHGHYEITGVDEGAVKVRFRDCSNRIYLDRYLGGVVNPSDSPDVVVSLGQETSGHDQALVRGGSISGALTVPPGAAPPSYSCVEAYQAGDDPYSGRAVEVEGGVGPYEVTGLEPGSYLVRFSECDADDNYHDVWYDGANSEADATPVNVTVGSKAQGISATLTAASRISGTITDADTGAPVPGACAEIHIASDTNDWDWVDLACADDDGHYRSSALDPGQYLIRFTDWDGLHQASWFNGKDSAATADLIRVDSGASVNGVDGALSPGGAISGKVRDDDSNPLAACIYLWNLDSSTYFDHSVCTDDDGAYRFGGVTPGRYAVQFSSQDGVFDDQWYGGAEDVASASQIDVVTGVEVTDIDLTAGSLTGARISGVVTAADSGAPVPNTCVYVIAADTGYYVASACTDSSGAYQTSVVRAGDYKLSYDTPDDSRFLDGWLGGSNLSDAEVIHVSVGVDLTEENIVLTTGALVSGSLHDSVSGNGIPDLCFAVYTGAYDQYLGRACADDHGDFTSPGIPAGDYLFAFNNGANDNGPYLDHVYNSPSPVGLGDVLTGVDIDLTRGGRFSGTVRDQSTSAPLRNICVTAVAVPSGTAYDSLCSSNDGHFQTVGLPAGNYQLQFTNGNGRYVAEWYDNVATQVDAAVLPVLLGQDSTGIEVDMQLGGNVSGTVVSSTTGQPLSGVCVTLLHASDGTFGGLGGCTDAAGHYSSAAVPAGSYKVKFAPGDDTYLGQYYDHQDSLGNATPISVVAGATVTNVDAALERLVEVSPGMAAFTGTVVDSVGTPVAGACLRVAHAGDVVASTTTSADGTYILTNLTPDSYKLWVSDCARGDYASVSRVHSLNPDEVEVENFALTTVGTGFVRVTTNPATSAQISVDGEPADRWGLTWMKVPAGDHVLSFGDAAGLTPPEDQTVTVEAGQTTTTVADFAERGYLRVLTDPAVPSTISVNGKPRDDWGMWTDVPVGTYSVCFGAVAGYDAPGCQQIQVTAGQTSTATGSFTANTDAPSPDAHGLLRVTTSPALPGQILVDGHIADTWGLTWLKLSPGSHTVSFTDVEGYRTPASKTINIQDDQTTEIVGEYQRNGTLRVTSTPALPTTVFVDGVPRNDWGLWTDVPVGSHQVCFGQVIGFVGPACATYDVTAGNTTTVTGSFSADTTAPDPVSGLTASGQDGAVVLNWSASPSDDVTGYLVYRSSGGGNAVRVTTEPLSGTTFIDSGLQSGTSYDYQVIAVDRAGNVSHVNPTVSATTPSH